MEIERQTAKEKGEREREGGERKKEKESKKKTANQATGTKKVLFASNKPTSYINLPYTHTKNSTQAYLTFRLFR